MTTAFPIYFIMAFSILVNNIWKSVHSVMRSIDKIRDKWTIKYLIVYSKNNSTVGQGYRLLIETIQYSKLREYSARDKQFKTKQHTFWHARLVLLKLHCDVINIKINACASEGHLLFIFMFSRFTQYCFQLNAIHWILHTSHNYDFTIVAALHIIC